MLRERSDSSSSSNNSSSRSSSSSESKESRSEFRMRNVVSNRNSAANRALVPEHEINELQVAILLRITHHNFLFDKYERASYWYSVAQGVLFLAATLTGALGYLDVGTSVIVVTGALLGGTVKAMSKLKRTLPFDHIRNMAEEQRGKLASLSNAISAVGEATRANFRNWKATLAALNANDDRMSSEDRAAFYQFCKEQKIPYSDNISKLRKLLRKNAKNTVVISQGSSWQMDGGESQFSMPPGQQQGQGQQGGQGGQQGQPGQQQGGQGQSAAPISFDDEEGEGADFVVVDVSPPPCPPCTPPPPIAHPDGDRAEDRLRTMFARERAADEEQDVFYVRGAQPRTDEIRWRSDAFTPHAS